MKTVIVNLSAAFCLLSSASYANATTQHSRSIAMIKSQSPKQGVEQLLLQTPSSKTRALAFKGMKRQQVIDARLLQPELVTKSSQPSAASLNYYSDFAIYSAFSELLFDQDDDGFYQRFSVTFDADILSAYPNQQALVFADLYLSQNGGPWLLYFTTDSFAITGQDSTDAFEVVTQLDTGYNTDHYDVLIDLYQVGVSEPVATYSANDTNALYALPLESRDYDPEYVVIEYVEHYQTHSGGIGLLMLAALVLLALRRAIVSLTVVN